MNTFMPSDRQPERYEACLGLIAPKPVLLDIDSHIYRFGDRSSMVLDHRAGSWWIREDAFELIMERARHAAVDLSHKAQWDLAIKPEWSHLDVALRAIVRGRLWAWEGLARPQTTKVQDRILRMCGNPSIRQLYLIGVVEPRRRVGDAERIPILTQRGRDAFSITGVKPIRGAPPG